MRAQPYLYNEHPVQHGVLEEGRKSAQLGSDLGVDAARNLGVLQMTPDPGQGRHRHPHLCKRAQKVRSRTATTPGTSTIHGRRFGDLTVGHAAGYHAGIPAASFHSFYENRTSSADWPVCSEDNVTAHFQR